VILVLELAKVWSSSCVRVRRIEVIGDKK